MELDSQDFEQLRQTTERVLQFTFDDEELHLLDEVSDYCSGSDSDFEDTPSFDSDWCMLTPPRRSISPDLCYMMSSPDLYCNLGLNNRIQGTLLVESDLVGLIVGPKGSTILSIKNRINEAAPSYIPADITTPKIGAEEAVFTITGTPEQVRLAKEMMCLYVKHRDPSRMWPDTTVQPNSQAKQMIADIMLEQKQIHPLQQHLPPRAPPPLFVPLLSLHHLSTV